MPRVPNTVPTYRLHAASGQAVSTVRLSDGSRKDLYLGIHGTAASRAEYQRIVALVVTNGGIYPTGSIDLTINEALVQYGRFVESYYIGPDGKPTGTSEDIKVTLGYLRKLFGPTSLAEFGPPQLKVVRQAMVDDDRVREQVNKRTSQVRQFFRWCVEEQLVPPTVLLGLQAVRPLACGRSGVKEGLPRQPADPVAVQKALPFMPPAIRAVALVDRRSTIRDPVDEVRRTRSFRGYLGSPSQTPQDELARQVSHHLLRTRGAGRPPSLARMVRARRVRFQSPSLGASPHSTAGKCSADQKVAVSYC